MKNIKTAEELVLFAEKNGICMDYLGRMQDIIGHSTTEELVKIANEHTKTFYWILFKAWDWQDAVVFWNKHTNIERRNDKEEMGLMEGEIKDLHERIKAMEEASKKAETVKANALTLNKWLAEEKIKTAGLEEQLAAKDQEIFRLKAKLFDLMDK